MFRSLLLLLLFGISSLDVYSLGSGDVARLGQSAKDIADSLFGNLADLLPVMVPIIAVTFGLMFVIIIANRR